MHSAAAPALLTLPNPHELSLNHVLAKMWKWWLRHQLYAPPNTSCPTRAQGNLLDDKELVGVLGVTKATAGEVNARLAAASEARKRISDACEEYRPVAHRAQLLYFLIAQFSTVNAMYQTSLAQARRLPVVAQPPGTCVYQVLLELLSSVGRAGSGQRLCHAFGCCAPACKRGNAARIQYAGMHRIRKAKLRGFFETCTCVSLCMAFKHVRQPVRPVSSCGIVRSSMRCMRRRSTARSARQSRRGASPTS